MTNSAKAAKAAGASATRQSALKWLQLVRTPPVLTLHLKRFAASLGGGTRKLSTPVPFPARLDVAPFCVQAEAPMHLVHFYFSQLTLNSVFVVDKGRFVGMINKADMINNRF